MAYIHQLSRLLGIIIGVGLGAVLLFLASAWARILIGVVLGTTHLIRAELLRRDEPVGQFGDYVQSLLRFDSGFRRKLGGRIQRRWLPDLPS